MDKKHRFYYICFDVAGYDQHNAFTDNAYYFQLYIRDRNRIIDSELSKAHVGYVDALSEMDAVDRINDIEGDMVMSGMSEIQFLYLTNLDIPFAATADEMDIIDEVISYDSSFDVEGIAGRLFESMMRLKGILDTICCDKEIKKSMQNFFQMATWYTVMIHATSSSVSDCSVLPDKFVDELLENLPDREYATTLAMEASLAYYNFIDYDYTYYNTIIGDNGNIGALQETIDLNSRYGSAIIDDVV